MLLSFATLIWLGMKLCRSRFATATRDSTAQTEPKVKMPDKMYVTALGECVHCDENSRGLNGSRTVQEKRRCSVCCPV